MTRAHSVEKEKSGWRKTLDGILSKRTPVIRETPRPLRRTVVVEVGGSAYAVNVEGQWASHERTQEELEGVALGKWITDMGKRVGEAMSPATIEELQERFPTHMAMLESAEEDARRENEDPMRGGPRSWMELGWASRQGLNKASPSNFLLILDTNSGTYLRQLSVLEDLETIHTIFSTPAKDNKFQSSFKKAYQKPGFNIWKSHPLYSQFGNDPTEVWNEYQEDTRVAF